MKTPDATPRLQPQASGECQPHLSFVITCALVSSVIRCRRVVSPAPPGQPGLLPSRLRLGNGGGDPRAAATARTATDKLVVARSDSASDRRRFRTITHAKVAYAALTGRAVHCAPRSPRYRVFRRVAIIDALPSGFSSERAARSPPAAATTGRNVGIAGVRRSAAAPARPEVHGERPRRILAAAVR